MKRLLPSLLLLLLATLGNPAVAAPDPTADNPMFKQLQACDVSWDSLGTDSADSMPLGNGDIALNAWTEQNGDLVFYISKSDAWDEADSLVKVGRVRITLAGNPFAAGFKQTLRLQEGAIALSGGAAANQVTVRVWVDANHPVIHVETSSAQPLAMGVMLDPWRTTPGERGVSADVVMPGKDEITWYHHNAHAGIPHLQNITFGATMKGEGFVSGEGNTLHSAQPQSTQHFSIYPLTATTPEVSDWQAKLAQQVASLAPLDWANCWAEHVAWWERFWERSWIFVQGDADAAKVTEGYVLQRFVSACAGRGAYAIKYNGSIFTMDNPSEDRGKDLTTGKKIVAPVTADFRAWGGQYWFQNTRPIYWPMLAQGDFDEMLPLFKMYRDKLPESLEFVKQNYGHDGAYFAETAPFWAQLHFMPPSYSGKYTDRYFTPILEITAMMLDYYDYTQDQSFVRETLLPVAKAGLTFFSEHFPRDAQGKLFFDKDNSIEMYWDVSNPLPDIAGLHYDIARLLELPPSLLDDATRDEWKKLRSILPDIPKGTKDGKPVLLPYAGEQTAPQHNSENPELYAVYPFRIYGLDKPDYDLALNTFNARLNKRTGCWYQDPVQAAMLGLTELAKKDVTFNLTNKDPRLRFPAFWQRGHDYMPDEDNGGNGELALEKMLLECDGRTILLLPAWPKEWSADFKVRAPFQTTLEGRVEEGRIVNLKVTPENRRQDVKVH